MSIHTFLISVPILTALLAIQPLIEKYIMANNAWQDMKKFNGMDDIMPYHLDKIMSYHFINVFLHE
jgi:hypothetical protein